jgi:hypothetical protein
VGVGDPHFLLRFSTATIPVTANHDGSSGRWRRIGAKFCTYLPQVFQAISTGQIFYIQIFTRQKELYCLVPTRTLLRGERVLMARPRNLSGKGQIFVFPRAQLQRHISLPGESPVVSNPLTNTPPESQSIRHAPLTAVLCGSFRKDPEGITRACEQLRKLGCRVLELRHLEAIQQAHFVWLHTPKGYIGNITALEIGFACASGVPIFSSESPKDVVLQKFVHVVTSPRELILNMLDRF